MKRDVHLIAHEVKEFLEVLVVLNLICIMRIR
jgi:hypothetical protein